MSNKHEICHSDVKFISDASSQFHFEVQNIPTKFMISLNVLGYLLLHIIFLNTTELWFFVNYTK